MAKEKFRSINFTADTLLIIERANRIIRDYTRMGVTITLRQLYYRFIGLDLFPSSWIDPEYNAKQGLQPNTKNTVKNYKRLAGIIADARDAGMIDWNAIADLGRVQQKRNHWKNPAGVLDSAAWSFGLDLWHGQDNHVVVMVEKDAVTSVIKPVCVDRDVTFIANKGYSSASTMYRIGKELQGKFLGKGSLEDYGSARQYVEDYITYGEDPAYRQEEHFYSVGELEGEDDALFNARVAAAQSAHADWEMAYERDNHATQERLSGQLDDTLCPAVMRSLMRPHPDGGKAIHVIYMGDFDPSGQDMTRDVKERLEQYSRVPITVHRVALNYDQITRYNLPENPAKLSDPRADEYIKKYGNKSWELDAVEPNVLQDIVRDAIVGLCDMDKFNERHEKQEGWRKELQELARDYEAKAKEAGEGGDDEEESEDEDGEDTEE